MTQRHPILSRIAAVGAFFGVVVLALAGTSVFITGKPCEVEFGPFNRFFLDGGAVDLRVLIEGDSKAMVNDSTIGAWTRQIGIGDYHWEVELLKSRGTTRMARIIHVKLETWWLLLALFLPALQLASLEYRARTAHRAGTCENCGYDLRASGPTCPECGAARSA